MTRDRDGNWLGGNGPCEHRTVGPHRAWCLTCSTWCYPTTLCPRCELARRDEAVT